MDGLEQVVGGGVRASCLMVHGTACRCGSYHDTDQCLSLGSASSIGSEVVVVAWLVPGGLLGAAHELL